MANLPETSTFTTAITQIDDGEAATGGAGGVANRALIQLGNRTRWLFDRLQQATANAFAPTGDYANLRARGTTKDDVGLGQLQNLPRVDDPAAGNASQYASGQAVKALSDQIAALGGSASAGVVLPTDYDQNVFAFRDSINGNDVLVSIRAYPRFTTEQISGVVGSNFTFDGVSGQILPSKQGGSDRTTNQSITIPANTWYLYEFRSYRPDGSNNN